MPVRLGLSLRLSKPTGGSVNRPYQRRLSRRLGWLLLRTLMLDRYFFFRSDFVFRFGHAHQPVIEPADNILQPFDPMPRLSGTRQLVRFIWKTHHHRRNFAELERAEHFFAARAWRCPEIGLA